MQRGMLWAAGAAGDGLLVSAFLSVGVALAEGGDGAVTDNAFTIGEFTFHPGDDGYSPISPISQLSPLLGIGGASISKALTSAGLARQRSSAAMTPPTGSTPATPSRGWPPVPVSPATTPSPSTA